MESFGAKFCVLSHEYLTSELQHIKKHTISSKSDISRKKVRKGTRGMPWLSEAMKDVISCDKPRGLANMN
jgi:hypothetical protein